MKIRQGFVSNSSSTSFICKLCGRDELGWDWDDPSHHGMARCENGHTLCMDHFSFDQNSDIDFEEVPSKWCPLCRNNSNSLKDYLIKNSGKTVNDLIREICGEVKTSNED